MEPTTKRFQYFTAVVNVHYISCFQHSEIGWEISISRQTSIGCFSPNLDKIGNGKDDWFLAYNWSVVIKKLSNWIKVDSAKNFFTLTS